MLGLGIRLGKSSAIGNSGNPNPELIIGNAASYTSEANSVANGNNQTLSSHVGATNASVAEATNGKGSYVVEATAVDGTADNCRHYYNSAVNGEIYEYKILCRATVGTSQRFSFTNTTVSQSTNFSHSGWVEYTGEIQATGTQIILNMFPAVSGAAGDKLQYKYSLKLKND